MNRPSPCHSCSASSESGPAANMTPSFSSPVWCATCASRLSRTACRPVTGSDSTTYSRLPSRPCPSDQASRSAQDIVGSLIVQSFHVPSVGPQPCPCGMQRLVQRVVLERARTGEVLRQGGLRERRDLVFADADGPQAGRGADRLAQRPDAPRQAALGYLHGL